MTRYRYLKGNVTAEKLLEGIETRLSTYLKRQNSRTWDHVDYTSLPKFLHDNEFLLSGHRPELNSVTECLKTVFMVHSETGNIWTHGLGAVTCMFLSFYYLTYVARDWQHGLAFAVFFMGAVLCLGTSAVYHLFICHSEGVCKFLAKMDYCGIIILNIASYVPWLRFAFYQDWTTQAIYMLLITVLGLCGIAVVIRDEFREPQFRHMRFGLFLSIGLAGFIPSVHCILFTDFLRIIGFPYWLVLTGVLYFIGGLTYSTRVPESLWPGKFDIWCQSHQIMHVCVIGGVLSCYQGAAELAALRLNY